MRYHRITKQDSQLEGILSDISCRNNINKIIFYKYGPFFFGLSALKCLAVMPISLRKNTAPTPAFCAQFFYHEYSVLRCIGWSAEGMSDFRRCRYSCHGARRWSIRSATCCSFVRIDWLRCPDQSWSCCCEHRRKSKLCLEVGRLQTPDTLLAQLVQQI